MALAAVVLAGGGLRACNAATPTRGQSADERAYAKLALNLANQHDYGGTVGLADPLHWPPGAPALFAVAHWINPEPAAEAGYRGPARAFAAYWAQAIVGTLIIPVVFAIAALVAEPGPGLLAAAAVAAYPPLIGASRELISEPFGALMLALGILALAWACTRVAVWWFGAAGLLLGAAVLVRADLLLAPFVVAAVVGVATARRAGRRRGFSSAGALCLGALVVILPWTASASAVEGRFVPVTVGGGAAVYVGTYLPGGGTTAGLKRRFADEVHRRHPGLDARSADDLEARLALDIVATAVWLRIRTWHCAPPESETSFAMA